MHADHVWTHARLATMRPDLPGLGIVEDGVIAAHNGRIIFAGPASDAPAFTVTQSTDLQGRWVTPGLIDCHTHLVHAGDRAHEFELRLQGATYEEIARAGGGIVSTMRATRAATLDTLICQALPRLDALLAEGVTTVEVKSGYGLTLADEVKMLRAARALADHRPVDVATTFLGAHAVPPEYAEDHDAYIDLVCRTMIPHVAQHKLADAVDGFCEGIGFSLAQVRRVFHAAKANGLALKLHAEQLSNLNGAALAAQCGALSADHLEHVDEPAVRAMAQSSTVAVMLPGAYYFTRDTKLPPIDLFRTHGVPMAVATDCNPGTAPLTSLLLSLNMAATLFRMSVEECLLGATRVAAKALGRQADIGTLEAGKQCDLAIWDIERPAELVYRMGFNPLHARIHRGI
ncbi:imidazolonepropionase [Niveispirillum cyanobacteriorum]|uniref:Imidazolonepropionase n=1 Tax=Niveispirillum cyanobacteriorum TaxID=1612173 RepID=A0A2K9NIS1_9PROT|nr:imidazolonepropionase [Niveispirillum cyanobacteriorum]AUN32988.1 imidazolonepropionase [Niveispirillum cyanobacteriorum]GGE46428.1 imidazolonepropionase [Niveispirillum cyanobacteriorum]